MSFNSFSISSLSFAFSLKVATSSVKADIFSFNDLIDKANGSMVTAKEKGLVRSEGKDYIMQDGDIVLFRFNV